jgi:hypothetical protein
MEFSIFDGEEDAYWWILCIEKYFKIKGTSEAGKILVAGLAMDGCALKWWLWWSRCHPTSNWDTFTIALLWRFKHEWRHLLPALDENMEEVYEPLKSIEKSSITEDSIVNRVATIVDDDENEAKEIDDDGLMMYPGDKTKHAPNHNDNSDSIIDSISNSIIKDLVHDTTIVNSSNFLCLPPLSYFTFSHVSLGFGSLSPPMNIQKCGHSSLMSTKLGISVFGLPLIVQISLCFEQSATPHVWDTTTYDPGGSLIHSNYNLEDKVVVDEWSNDTCINKLLLLLLFNICILFVIL